jgi:hypothetical protein
MQVSGQVSGSAGGAAMLQQMRDRIFARADKDGDGGLSLDEFKAMAKRPPREAGSAAPAAGVAAGQAGRTDRAAAAFSALDTNGDGKLSGAELEQGRRSRHAGREGLSALLGLQEGAQAASGLEALMGRALRAYGGAGSAA